jgi:FMN phosphatase YigB (HAD superfamily)
MTFLAAFGAIVAAGRYHAEVFDLLEIPDWRAHADEAERRYGGFQTVDLYPDALPAIAALRAAGYGVSVIANQPAIREGQLRAIGVRADVMGMSGALGVSKPEAGFFERALQLMGDPAPADVAYVGDRPDNDVAPAAAAGMRAVWLRRGPWGVIAREAPGAHLVVRSLQELVERLPEVWPEDAAASTLA